MKSVYCFMGFGECLLKTFANRNAAERYKKLAEDYYFETTGRKTKYGVGFGIVECPTLSRIEWESDRRFPKTAFVVSTGKYASNGGYVEMIFDELADADTFAKLLNRKTSIDELPCLREADVEKLFDDPDELELIFNMFNYEYR